MLDRIGEHYEKIVIVVATICFFVGAWLVNRSSVNEIKREINEIKVVVNKLVEQVHESHAK